MYSTFLARPLTAGIFMTGIAATTIFIGYEIYEYQTIQMLATTDPKHHAIELVEEANHFLRNMIAIFLICAVCSLGLMSLYFQNRRRLNVSLSDLQRQSLAIAGSRDGISVSDQNGIFVYSNKAHYTMYGYDDPAALIGQSWQMLYTDQEGQRLSDVALPILEETGVWRGLAVGKKQDGTLFDQELSLSRYPDGIVCIVQDRTEHNKHAQNLEMLSSAINMSEEAIAVLGDRNQILYANNAVFKLFGPLGFDNFTPETQRKFNESIARIKHSKAHQTIEDDYELQSGRMCFLSISLSSHIQNTVLVMMRDISGRKANALEMENLRHQFYQAQKMEALGRMAGGMAHDFNNILAAIMGNAEFLMEDLPKASQEHEFATKIHEAGREARGVIDQILTYARRNEVNVDDFDLVKATQETKSIIEGVVSGETVIIWDVPHDHIANVAGNSSQIKQCLINLCDNAKDALPDGRGSVTIRVTPVDDRHPHYNRLLTAPPDDALTVIDQISDDHTVGSVGYIQPDKNYVSLSVSDTGTGIPVDILEQIFEPFFTTKPIHEGTGLGLSAVQGIALNHNGAVIVDTILGHGTTFEIILPTINTQTVPVKAAPVLQESGDGQLVIVIDDQSNVLDVSIRNVKRLGYFTRGFTSALDALAFVQQDGAHNVLAILTDQSMPDMTGTELAAALYEQGHDLPVIILSGYSTESLVARQEDYPNITTILRKPLVRQDLADALEQCSYKAQDKITRAV